MDTNNSLTKEIPQKNLFKVISLLKDMNKNQNESKLEDDCDEEKSPNNKNLFSKNMFLEYLANGNMLFMY